MDGCKSDTETGYKSEVETGYKLDAELIQTEKGLGLSRDGQIMVGDFSHLLRRTQKHTIGAELVVKAARMKNGPEHPILLDATAGMGEESFLLAAYGFTVKMYERNPVIAALLRDSLERAKADPATALIAANMELVEEDSIKAMQGLDYRPDVILLDPMFPERQKSALVKKKFQLIHTLEAPCTDEEELLAAAVLAGPSKIIIKRPIKAPFLAGRKPSYDVRDKIIRYDCIVL